MSYEAESGTIRIALAGEAMITRGLMAFREERFLGLRSLLLGADVRFANSEMLFHNYEDWPTYLSQTYMRCDPRFIADLQWLGINLVSCANNHGYDYGENGVLTNLRNLDAAGLVHAGSGKHYAAAMAPAYLETPAGRVGLVSATSSARANSRAGEQRRDMNGRPGVNLVRWINEWRVDETAFSELRRVADVFGWRQRQPGWFARGYDVEHDSPDDVVYLADRNTLGVGSEDLAARFVQDPGGDFGRHSRAYVPDVARNVASVREARRMADWVIFSVHNHEGGASVEEPSDHIRELAHAVIDAGADVVIGHGPHVDRGIELYHGKPIVYSLGNFIMQNDQVERMPHDSMLLWDLGHDNVAADLFDAREGSRQRAPEPGPGWWSAIVMVSFEARRLAEMRVHPIELGFGLPRPQTGRPMLAEADGDLARRAIERFARLSAPFGVTVGADGCVSWDR